MKSRAAIVLISGLICLAFRGAGAMPLDKQACADLALEKQGLQSLKVEEMMAKGPEWAAANLSQGDLNLIRRYIEVDELIKFRCTPAQMLVKLPGLDEEDGDAGVGSGPDGDGEAGQSQAAAAAAPPLPRKK